MKKTTFKKGFSLVEMIVVIAVMALVLPAVFSIVFSILKQEVNAYELMEVKRQGDGALSTIQNDLRPVTKITLTNTINEICAPGNGQNTYSTTSGTDVTFLDNNNNSFQISIAQNHLRYNTLFLTTSKVIVSNFLLKCDRQSSDAPAIVTVQFNLSYNSTQPSNPTLKYHTRIVLRNY